jgi:hypothetical protein
MTPDGKRVVCAFGIGKLRRCWAWERDVLRCSNASKEWALLEDWWLYTRSNVYQ